MKLPPGYKPHPKALAFRDELLALIAKHTGALSASADDRIAYVSILGVLYAEGCSGCKHSGVPLDIAIGLVRQYYGGTPVDLSTWKDPS